MTEPEPIQSVATLYTLSGIAKVGDQLLRQSAEAQQRSAIDLVAAYAGLYGRVDPPTRPQRVRNRIKWRVAEYRERLSLAVDALRGRHDCGDY